ncbi:hypothetical protein D0B54_04745 [Solimonas sp. K1W22B-7]|uniref:hypothetical protein n=1 Tax=Solimonas sp. K1W22B-7 TaxID=2303331 RepID=UPI000E33082D|nr:hypothetical protein [Solimonas sp. K1W22B-7]AXQ28021.1 hypothetical protein D0B54_04745 [Solimonas sp. K1W22B-7]
MQPATILSDAVLCACALAALGLARPRRLAMAGFALMALAAAAGCLRYGPLPQLQPLHQGLSFITGTLGLPLVLLGYLAPPPRVAAMVIGALLLLSAAAWMQPGARLVVALATLLGWATLLVRDRGDRRVAAAIALGIAASLAAGIFAPQGRHPDIDVMHYALALAQLAFGAALYLRYKSSLSPLPTQARPGETCTHDASTAPP